MERKEAIKRMQALNFINHFPLKILEKHEYCIF